MASRTYLVGLWLASKALKKYITRWQVQIEDNTSPETYSCVLAVLTALDECLPLIQPNPPVT